MKDEAYVKFCMVGNTGYCTPIMAHLVFLRLYQNVDINLEPLSLKSRTCSAA